MTKPTTVEGAVALFCLVVVLTAAAVLHVHVWNTDTGDEDIYYAWVEGGRILNGENPYARILTGNMRDNQKYATYFPVFYELSALARWGGLRDYGSWIDFWRSVFLACSLAIASTLFLLLYPRGGLPAAIFAAALWLFNRWTLYVAQVAHLDFIPILLLLLSLWLFRGHRWTSLVLFSVSLAIKQIAVFLVPLYLVWIWQEAPRDRLKQTFFGLLVIISVPLVSSLPFLIWNAEALLKSLLFSVTRSPGTHFGAESVDGLLGWRGPVARVAMFALMGAAYVLAWTRRVGRHTASLFVMVAFVDFNAVLFRQYMVWIVALTPLVLLDAWDAEEPGILAS